MKALYVIFFVPLTLILVTSCTVQSEDTWNNDSTITEQTSMDSTQNISVFVDSKEQKWFVSLDNWTKVDINKLKESPDIITTVDWEDDCVSSIVNYEESIQDWVILKPQTLDVTLDLTKIGQWDDLAKLTQSRIETLKTLVDGELYEWVKMNPGDSMILRFIWTIDYWINWKNLPLNDKISIKLSEKVGKSVKISNIECVKNKRKKLIYLKINSENISIDNWDDIVKKNKNYNIKNEVNSTQKFEVADTDSLINIVTKEFDMRSENDKYAKWSYILEFLDQSDILDSKVWNVNTFIFTDANFQLHPNFLKNYANPYNIKLDEVWDFSPDVYNAHPQSFSSFYRYLATDPYITSIKQKCAKNNSLYLIGTKSWTNKYFNNILEIFYTKLLPNCKIIFN